MNNFNIVYNKEKSKVDIDIFGEIGQSWFGDGVTFDDVHSKLKEVEADEIILNIRSFGGDVDHAFSIYNLLKSSPARVTANIIGMTASAGTIIAMAADTVNMAENAEFLVHNSWSMIAANSEGLHKQARLLENIDDNIVKIYKKKLGNKRTQREIRDLMEKEEWLSAKQAKDFGFIDNITEATKIAASMYNSEAYNIFKTKKNKSMDYNTLLGEIKNIFNSASKKEKEENVSEKEIELKNSYLEKIIASEEKVHTLTKEIKGIENALKEKETTLSETLKQLEEKNASLQAKLDKLEGINNIPAPKADAGVATPENKATATIFDDIVNNLKRKYKN